MLNAIKRYEYHGADCFEVYVPSIGPAQAIYYDVSAIRQSIRYVKDNHIEKPIFYILACRIGPFMKALTRQIHELGGLVFVNPDGHEWLRAKWSKPVRQYWKLSEQLMVKNADLLICDSKHIEKYIRNSYTQYSPRTTFIAYGADVPPRDTESQVAEEWFISHNVSPNHYFLIVGRFVPENNYETMIREFMLSGTKKQLVILTNVEHNKFFDELKNRTNFEDDPRIKFEGTMYDPDVLLSIRQNAFGYLHGHSVGGTNPSLLEALAATKLNLLYDVGFNREVAENSGLYWNKKRGNLASLIDKVDTFSDSTLRSYDALSTAVIRDRYSWSHIVNEYEKEFTNS